MRNMGPTSSSEWWPPERNRSTWPEQSARTSLTLHGTHFRLLQIFVIGAIWLLACEALWAQAQGQSNPGEEKEDATIEVHLQLTDGLQFSGVARVRILTLDGQEVSENGVAGTSETGISGIRRGSYNVEASAPGFVTARETVDVFMKSGSVTVFLTMQPIRSDKPESTGISAPILAPAARKEMAKGVEQFRQKDLKEARKHFEKVLIMAPGSPDIHFLMGALEMQEHNVAAAKDHLEKAIQLFPNHAPSLELLGGMYCQQGEPQKGVVLLEKAASLEDGSWNAHWKLGAAYLQLNEPEKARQQAERALELGKGAAGRAQILRARALAHLDQWDAAEESLARFVHDQPDDPAAAEARAFLVLLKKRQEDQLRALPLAASEPPDLSPIAGLRPIDAALKNPFWTKPGVDEFVPGVKLDVPCSLPEVLKGAGKTVEQLMANLEKFTANEQVKHFTVDRTGEMHSPDTRSFDYVVFVSHEPHGVIYLEEYRDGSLSRMLFPAGVATEGLPAMALIFHPQMASDFAFVCEGLGQTDGHPAWQVHFQQRADRAVRIRAYVIAGTSHPVALKGRAWIDAGTFQVARLESELVSPMPDIRLIQEHLSIEYAPVQFHSQNSKIWLPHTAELFVERSNSAFYRTHTFTKFRLFNVDVSQKLQAPKESYTFTNFSDRAIRGKLTITPLPERSLTPISITFTIPPRDSVFKLVGQGKDLDIPVDSIESARFVYSGAAGIIQGGASLSKPSTLEIDPEAQLPAASPDD